jgi:hypothetical protein
MLHIVNNGVDVDKTGNKECSLNDDERIEFQLYGVKIIP